MKIVIDIPKMAYENTKRFGKLSTINDDELAKAICNGIPLPKGHGRLIDEKKLLDTFWTYCGQGDFGYHQAEDLIKSASTIIEAESEIQNDTDK